MGLTRRFRHCAARPLQVVALIRPMVGLMPQAAALMRPTARHCAAMGLEPRTARHCATMMGVEPRTTWHCAAMGLEPRTTWHCATMMGLEPRKPRRGATVA